MDANQSTYLGVQCMCTLKVLAYEVNRGYLLLKVNSKYISSSKLKTSEFSRDEIYLVFAKKK